MASLGMAGLAEAAFAAAWGMMCLGVVLVLVLALAGLLLRSELAARFSFVANVFTTILFYPWKAFSPEPTEDSDLQSFQASFLTLAWMWVAASALSITSCIWTYATRAAEPSPSDEARATARLPRIAWYLTFGLGRFLLIFVSFRCTAH